MRARPKFGGAIFVAAGILLSRISGLIRMRALAHYLGDSSAADAFYAALKIPNFPQNLLGEGVLSASFIPVYANAIARGDRDIAGKVAGGILSLLAVLVGLITIGGIAATPWLIDLIAPGFTGETRLLTIRLVQIIFPGTGLLVFSAWCLGILNSHGKFFLSYAAPVVWNGLIILALWCGRNAASGDVIAQYAAWGLVGGSLAQFLIQLPTTLRLIPDMRVGFFLRLDAVRTVVRNFVPVVIGRGVIQFSAYIDTVLASFLPGGAVAALGYAQSIYMLPMSLFGMSVSAAELPAMSHAFGQDDIAAQLRTRLTNATRRIAYFVIPSAVGLVAVGDVVAAFLFQTGEFTAHTAHYVWMALIGSAVGLLASTLGRLYASAFYALRDTRTPLRYSLMRVGLTCGLGWAMGLALPRWLGIDPQWGTAGLTASAGIAGWIEFLLLRHGLIQRIGTTHLPLDYLARLWGAALLCGAVSYTVVRTVPATHPLLYGVAVIGGFAVAYALLTVLAGIPEARQLLRRVRR